MGESGAVPTRVEPRAELVSRIQAGDTLAEEAFVQLFRRGILVIATVRTRDREAAQDLTQEILIAVLKALRDGQLREAHKLSAFVQGTARNLINNYLRTRTRRSECELDPDIIRVDPVEAHELAERQRLLSRELQSFSALDQQILLLSLVDGHSLGEIAERLNLSHDAVRARKSRMLRRLTKKFQQLSQR